MMTVTIVTTIDLDKASFINFTGLFSESHRSRLFKLHELAFFDPEALLRGIESCEQSTDLSFVCNRQTPAF